MDSELVGYLDKMAAGITAHVDKRIDKLEARLDGIYARLDGIEVRLDGIDARLNGIDVRLDGIYARLDGIDVRLDGIDVRLDGIDARIDALRIEFARRLEATETRLLTEFYKWAQTNQIRMHSAETMNNATSVSQR